MRRTGLLVLVLGSALALGTVTGAVAAPEPSATRITGLSKRAGHVSYSRTIAVTGTGLDAVSALYLGSTRLADVRHVSPTRLTATVGHAPGFQPARPRLVAVVQGRRIDTGRVYTYRATSAVDREMRYLGANLHRQGPGGGYAYYRNEDCANFTSQTLRARGEEVTAAWRPGAADWVSSTRLRGYLLGTGRYRELTDTQAHRAQVRVGDVVQFDWDRSGDRDHTGIVTGIDRSASGRITVRYSAHTDMNSKADQNSPSSDRTIEEREAVHRKALGLHVTGRAYFLVRR